MGTINKLSDKDFTIACVHCGTTSDIQMWPHRDDNGKMVGLVFACSECSSMVPGATVTVAVTYTQEEGPDEQEISEGCICQSCGKRYRVDLNIPDEIWKRIKPEGKSKGAGLLCGSCIMIRIEAEGKTDKFETYRMEIQ